MKRSSALIMDYIGLRMAEKLGYYCFDESRVKEFQMAMYGSLYPDQYKFKYPKAGEDNSIVQIFVYELAKKRSFRYRN